MIDHKIFLLSVRDDKKRRLREESEESWDVFELMGLAGCSLLVRRCGRANEISYTRFRMRKFHGLQGGVFGLESSCGLPGLRSV